MMLRYANENVEILSQYVISRLQEASIKPGTLNFQAYTSYKQINRSDSESRLLETWLCFWMQNNEVLKSTQVNK